MSARSSMPPPSSSPAAEPFTDRAWWTEEPAGLYLHLPFCWSVCPYCDFAVLRGGASERARFVDDLVAEIRGWQGTEVVFDSIYLGGGTPSALLPEQIHRLLVAVRETFRFEPATTVCMEANPEDVSGSVAAEWREMGIDRLSLGVQSLDDQALRFLGRRHDSRSARRSIETVLQSAIPSVSVDLIYALPGQPRESWATTLAEVVSLGPQHLSCYELTVHEKTLFGVRARRGEIVEAGADERADVFLFTHCMLAEVGYEGYEVSNFSRGRAHRSRHNQKYWRQVPYLGLGPSAHSFDGARRWWNRRLVRDWRRALEAGERPVAEWENLDPTALVLERIMLALRTQDGVDLDQLGELFDRDLAGVNRRLISGLVAEGLLEEAATGLRPTLAGMAVADSLATSFEIPAAPG